jgi:hypothetical protein
MKNNILFMNLEMLMLDVQGQSRSEDRAWYLDNKARGKREGIF